GRPRRHGNAGVPAGDKLGDGPKAVDVDTWFGRNHRFYPALDRVDCGPGRARDRERVFDRPASGVRGASVPRFRHDPGVFARALPGRTPGHRRGGLRAECAGAAHEPPAQFHRDDGGGIPGDPTLTAMVVWHRAVLGLWVLQVAWACSKPDLR